MGSNTLCVLCVILGLALCSSSMDTGQVAVTPEPQASSSSYTLEPLPKGIGRQVVGLDPTVTPHPPREVVERLKEDLRDHGLLYFRCAPCFFCVDSVLRMSRPFTNEEQV